MSALHLSDVTLVAIDCVAHRLTQLALIDSLREIEPGAVHVWSDRHLLSGAEHHWCDLRSLRAVGETLWYDVPQHIATSHFLLVQYDGWVLDAKQWREEWLAADYVGAPWPWLRANGVGNGGFSLRSTALGRFLAGRRTQLPLAEPEDAILCQRYRGPLVAQGFRWPTVASAAQFSFERARPLRPTFGFHGLFNWSSILDRDALVDRMSLANDYVRSKPEWRELYVAARPMMAVA